MQHLFAIPPSSQGQVHLKSSPCRLMALKALIAQPKESELYTCWSRNHEQDGTVKLERHSITIVRGGQKSKTESTDTISFPTNSIPRTSRTPQSAGCRHRTVTPAGDATFAPCPALASRRNPSITVTSGIPSKWNFLRRGRQDRDLNLAPETSRRVGTVKWGLLEKITNRY